jgi:hypothetical protein
VSEEVSSVTLNASWYQHGSTNAFADVEQTNSTPSLDSNYVDGISLSVIRAGEHSREHLFTLATGLAAGQFGTSYDAMCNRRLCRVYHCPLLNCAYEDQRNCVGDCAPAFVKDAFVCDSGNVASSGGYANGFWYTDHAMRVAQVLSHPLHPGDVIEVRLIGDQPTANEDVGLERLELTLHDTAVLSTTQQSPESATTPPHVGSDTTGSGQIDHALWSPSPGTS